MKTAKLGAMFLISLMALAGIGVGYAAWTDTIYINGTVNTGSVEWRFIDGEYSGTWVYKDLLHDGPAEVHDWPAHGQGDSHHLLVAYAYAEEGYEEPGYRDHCADVVFYNIFPCIDFVADFTIEYTGSVPGKINSIDVYSWTGDMDDIYPYITVNVWIYDANGNYYDDYQDIQYPYTDLEGIQLHQDWTIYVEICIHLPQDNTLQGLSGTFDVSAEIVQWNEYPYTPGP